VHLKLVWPERAAPNSNEWRQANNPMLPGEYDAAGYEAADVQFNGAAWGGLEQMPDYPHNPYNDGAWSKWGTNNCRCSTSIQTFETGKTTEALCGEACVLNNQCRSFGIWTGVWAGRCILFDAPCTSVCPEPTSTAGGYTNDLYNRFWNPAATDGSTAASPGFEQSALLDGSIDSYQWFYAVGASRLWNGGFPGGGISGSSSSDPVGETIVELHAMCGAQGEVDILSAEDLDRPTYTSTRVGDAYTAGAWGHSEVAEGRWVQYSAALPGFASTAVHFGFSSDEKDEEAWFDYIRVTGAGPDRYVCFSHHTLITVVHKHAN
jgi:hypothetical protein